jgi:cytochrome c oxidase subunit II
MSLLLGAGACQPGPGGGPTIPNLPSIFAPASRDALILSNLSWGLHAIMTAVFVGVCIALALIYRRYRVRSADERGRLIYGSLKLEIAWTAAPTLILLILFILQLNVMCSVGAREEGRAEAPSDPVRVVAIGRQWWWEYQLPDLGIVTANELHLPVGRTVELELSSDDVLHNWWVPQLQGKRYNIPGKVNQLPFLPTEPGVFGGACGEFCGIQHAWMRIRVVVESPEQFAAWAQSQAQPARPPTSELVQRGQQLFAAKTCVSCHAVAGQYEATANAGPNLTHMASRATIGAGVLENTPENMARWLSAPQEVKPGNLMPNLRLTGDEVAALTAYMESLE